MEKNEQFMNKLWTSHEQVIRHKKKSCANHIQIVNELWASDKQVMSKSWTTNKIDTTKAWASYEEYMNKSRTNHGEVIRKEWTMLMSKPIKIEIVVVVIAVVGFVQKH